MRQIPIALVGVLTLKGAILFATPTVATYDLTVEVMWDQSDHEEWAELFEDIVNPHFSHLGGGTHNSSLSIWAPGESVAPGSGMELMQETGWIDIPDPTIVDLSSEFDAHIASGKSWSKLNWPQAFAAGSTTDLTFDVSSTHPLVTIMTMIGPSPDWFVGVSGLDLSRPARSVGSTSGWSDSVVVDLFAYNGGSEDGDEKFSLNGTGLAVHDPISLITSTPDGNAVGRTALNGNQVGRFTFQLNTVAVPEPSALTFFLFSSVLIGGTRWLIRLSKHRD